MPMMPQTESLRIRRLSRSGKKGKGAYAGVLQAGVYTGMDEKLATGAKRVMVPDGRAVMAMARRERS